MIEYAKNRIRYPSEFGPEYVNPYVLNMAVWNDNYLIDNNMMLSVKAKGTWYKILKRFDTGQKCFLNQIFGHRRIIHAHKGVTI